MNQTRREFFGRLCAAVAACAVVPAATLLAPDARVAPMPADIRRAQELYVDALRRAWSETVPIDVWLSRDAAMEAKLLRDADIAAHLIKRRRLL